MGGTTTGGAGRSIKDPENLAQIQGNIIGGFNKDYQAFLFLHFGYPAQARDWLGVVTAEVATSEEVLGFNVLYKLVRSRRAAAHRRDAYLPVTATWMNLALSYRGLTALEVPADELDEFPQEYRDGMKARAGDLGDTGPGAPANWVGPFGSDDDDQAIHAVMIVAADNTDDREHEVARQLGAMAPYGIQLLYRQDGTVRHDDPGHEHFGFKDGVSQPGIRDITPPNNPADANQGDPGQDLLWPGEFVLGYPTQGGVDDITVAGPPSANGPDWTVNGSYLVFRRLRQDVPGFHTFLATQAPGGLPADVFGAKIVGRYKSGAPLEVTKDAPAGRITDQGDPSQVTNPADPTLPDVSLVGAKINNFEYGDDAAGDILPRAAHIRKAYPRNQAPPGEGFTQTRRLLRRGIPYGSSFVDGSQPDSPNGANGDRGLCFACYQRSIANQFEFVQGAWVNNPDFPQPDDGEDAVIGLDQGPNPSINVRTAGQDNHVALMQRWVSTTGGEYFFQPSIDALQHLAAGGSSAQFYTVQVGDTLSDIAQQFYGDGNQWPRIFDANRDQITDPNLIFPGQVLRIP